MRNIVLALGLAAVAVAPANAAEPQQLEPSGKWAVSWEEGLCAVRHTFGSGEDQVDLALRPSPLNGPTEMFLLTKPPKMSFPSRQVTLAFDADDATADPYQSFVIKEPAQRVVQWSTRAPVLDKLQNARTMTLRVSGSTYRLVVPSAASALKALDNCQGDLLRHWGVDAAKFHAERRHASVADGETEKWFTAREYPGLMTVRGAKGRIVALLSISPAGKPTDCRIVNGSGNAELDAKTCEVAKQRGSFVPALDADGKVAASSYLLPVVWQLPMRRR